MSRITPGTGGSSASLQDFEPYVGYLTKKPEVVSGSEKYPAQRLEVTLALPGGDPNDTIKDWLSLKLGNTVAGDASKLKAFLNACAGKPIHTDIKWFDDVTFEWSYDETTAHMKLTEGLEVQFRGAQKVKGDGSSSYRIKSYHLVPAGAAAPPPPPGGEYQFTPDGKHRWKPGMAAWESVSTAAAPPPPPAAPVAPPPPPPAAEQPAANDEIPF